ncbi:hypothetical protein RDI58_021493 [Solanum bulbocastanum]|uniref:Uncharacterized protein n=1 Tax=Solanum bulbocastanum TaxID=147425 RepID=A0AAN8T129_SOLBU
MKEKEKKGEEKRVVSLTLPLD